MTPPKTAMVSGIDSVCREERQGCKGKAQVYKQQNHRSGNTFQISLHLPRDTGIDRTGCTFPYRKQLATPTFG